MKFTLGFGLFGLLLVVTAHEAGHGHRHGQQGRHHQGEDYDSEEPHGGGTLLAETDTAPKRFGVEFITQSTRSSPVKAIAFNVDRYKNWTEWSECLRADCIEERHRECMDDSWKEQIPNPILTTRCVSRFYVEKRTCLDKSLCSSSGLPEKCGMRPAGADSRAKVMGGSTAKPHSWPWAVRLSVKYRKQKPIHLCGGTLIAPNWILTAAHCLVRCASNIPVGEMVTLADYLPGTIYAHLGDHDLKVQEESQRDLRVTKAFIHPTYHKSLMTDGYDIALLYLSDPANMTSEVGAACLPTKEVTLTPGTKCYALGWGNTKSHGGPTLDNIESIFESIFPNLFQRPPFFSHPFLSINMRRRRREHRRRIQDSGELREVEIPIVDFDSCEKHYDKLSEELHICAGAKGKDTCEGDSGGGLYCQLPKSDRWYIAGITSFGIHRGCGRYPGVYTSVHAHWDWLNKTIHGSMYQES